MGPQLVRCGMSDKVNGIDTRLHASMGPQLVRCGMYGLQRTFCPLTLCFNGAATCSLRNAALRSRDDIGIGPLQWGRNLFVAECGQHYDRRLLASGFNGAATCSLRNVEKATVGVEKATLLQWGRNLFVAECLAPQRNGKVVAVASMGPQLVRCGMCPPAPARRWASRCFNGAATCSLRNAGDEQPQTYWYIGFNGAATCSLRNAAPIQP